MSADAKIKRDKLLENSTEISAGIGCTLSTEHDEEDEEDVLAPME